MAGNAGTEVKESTTFLSVIMILLGIVTIIIGQTQFNEGLWRKLFDSFGVLVTSIFVISFLYEKFLAEKHYTQFTRLLHDQLRTMDTISSKCMKMGILELFETRLEAESRYPLKTIIEMATPGSTVLCVARTLFHFLNKETELKTGLKKGLVFQCELVPPVVENQRPSFPEPVVGSGKFSSKKIRKGGSRYAEGYQKRGSESHEKAAGAAGQRPGEPDLADHRGAGGDQVAGGAVGG